MAEGNAPGFLEQLQMKNRLEQVTGGPSEKTKQEAPVQTEQGVEAKTPFQKTLLEMQRIANETVAKERAEKAARDRQAAEQAQETADKQEYDNVLAMINRQLAGAGRMDAVVPQQQPDDKGGRVAPATQAFLEGRGQKR